MNCIFHSPKTVTVVANFYRFVLFWTENLKLQRLTAILSEVAGLYLESDGSPSGNLTPNGTAV
jgi:hypothetical protein